MLKYILVFANLVLINHILNNNVHQNRNTHSGCAPETSCYALQHLEHSEPILNSCGQNIDLSRFIKIYELKQCPKQIHYKLIQDDCMLEKVNPSRPKLFITSFYLIYNLLKISCVLNLQAYTSNSVDMMSVISLKSYHKQQCNFYFFFFFM